MASSDFTSDFVTIFLNEFLSMLDFFVKYICHNFLQNDKRYWFAELEFFGIFIYFQISDFCKSNVYALP